MKTVIKQNFIGEINGVEFNDQGTFEMVEDFIKDIEYANNIEIKTENYKRYKKVKLKRDVSLFYFICKKLFQIFFKKHNLTFV